MRVFPVEIGIWIRNQEKKIPFHKRKQAPPNPPRNDTEQKGTVKVNVISFGAGHLPPPALDTEVAGLF